MKKLTKIAIALSVAGVALAGAAHAKSGVYVEGAGGWVQQKSAELDSLKDNNFADQKHIGGRADVGYNYDIDQSPFGIGAEFGWGYYGKTTINNTDVGMKSSAFDLLGVLTAHVTPKIDIFGKAGVARNEFKVSGNGIDDKTAHKFDPMVAVGAGYNITPSLQTNLTYSHIFGSNQDTDSSVALKGDSAPSINAVMVGLKYTF